MIWMLWVTLACGTNEKAKTEASSGATSSTRKAGNKAERRQIAKRQAARAASRAKNATIVDDLKIKDGGPLQAVFDTSKGEIHCQLLPELAPKTVLNFVQLAEGTKEWTHPGTRQKMNTSLYAGTIFHRVIPRFMIQGGDPIGKGIGGPGYRFEDEVHDSVGFDQPGLLAMANSGPNTNGSQFFITDRSTPKNLNGKHTIFGRCENLDVVQAIASVATLARNKPAEDVVLKTVRIVR